MPAYPRLLAMVKVSNLSRFGRRERWLSPGIGVYKRTVLVNNRTWESFGSRDVSHLAASLRSPSAGRTKWWCSAISWMVDVAN
jgi:hypothetical protein